MNGPTRARRHLRPSDYRVMPWRNGGGTTTELVVEARLTGAPTASVGEPFLYRVSIAEVAADGPFSSFAGIDRHILLLEGEGMDLDAGDHGRAELRPDGAAWSFSGDWPVSAKLVDGPVKDFNVMVDRARAAATLHAEHMTSPVVLTTDASVVWVRRGVIEGPSGDAGPGDTLVFEGSGVISPVDGPADVIVARVSIVTPHVSIP